MFQVWCDVHVGGVVRHVDVRRDGRGARRDDARARVGVLHARRVGDLRERGGEDRVRAAGDRDGRAVDEELGRRLHRGVVEAARAGDVVLDEVRRAHAVRLDDRPHRLVGDPLDAAVTARAGHAGLWSMVRVDVAGPRALLRDRDGARQRVHPEVDRTAARRVPVVDVDREDLPVRQRGEREDAAEAIRTERDRDVAVGAVLDPLPACPRCRSDCRARRSASDRSRPGTGKS